MAPMPSVAWTRALSSAAALLLAVNAAAVVEPASSPGLPDAVALAQLHLAVRGGELAHGPTPAEQSPAGNSSGGNKLMLFLHFAGAAGTSVCDFAKSCAETPASGVVMNFGQTAGNCNFYGSNPANLRARNDKLGTCSGLLEHASAAKSRSTWGFVQTALDVTPPCPAVSFLTSIREPWSRMRSHLTKHAASQWPPDAIILARDVYRRMASGAKGEEVAKLIEGKHFPSNGLGVVYLDNYYVRTLLGAEEGRNLPWGSLTEAHYERARAKLEAFDLVMPTEAMSDALAHIKCAAGPGYDLHKCPAQSVPRDNDHTYLLRSRPPAPELHQVEQLFNAQNKLDLRLYQWALARWNARQSSCSDPR